MKYINAADVLPEELLQEVSNYVSGELLYIPTNKTKCSWGEKSGSKDYYTERNEKIKVLFQNGSSIETLSDNFGLSYETIRKIIRR